MRPKCEACGKLIDYHGDACDPDDVRRHKANLRRRARSTVGTRGRREALESVGLVRGKDSTGRIVWE